jgi:hypothetical protein
MILPTGCSPNGKCGGHGQEEECIQTDGQWKCFPRTFFNLQGQLVHLVRIRIHINLPKFLHRFRLLQAIRIAGMQIRHQPSHPNIVNNANGFATMDSIGN